VDAGTKPVQSGGQHRTEPPLPGHPVYPPESAEKRYIGESENVEGLEVEIAALRARVKAALDEESKEPVAGRPP
jgi:hypothetical protein